VTERTVIEQRTLALAGVAQAARIVDLAAKTGSWPTPFVEASIHSLFCFEPEAVDSVFGTPQGIRLGLEQLSACLSLSQDESVAQTLRYTLAMLQLEKRFAKRDDLLSIVHTRLKHAAYSADNFSNNINTAQHLNSPHVADLVRALLLCGVRAAFLWRQLGGSRLKLMLSRGEIRDTAARLARDVSALH